MELSISMYPYSTHAIHFGLHKLSPHDLSGIWTPLIEENPRRWNQREELAIAGTALPDSICADEVETHLQKAGAHADCMAE